MRRTITSLFLVGVLAACVHDSKTTQNCWVESGWLDSTNGCSARAGYPDCYKVCADGSRTRVDGTQTNSKPAQDSGQTQAH
jgi:hypothetical protein